MNADKPRRAIAAAREAFVKQQPKVGEILVKAGVIDEMQLRAALGDQSNWGGRLGTTLVKMGLVEEHDLVRALAQQLRIPVVQLDGKRVEQRVLDLVPSDIAEKHLCVPLFVKEQNGVKTLYIGMDDPCNLEATDELAFRTGLRVQPVLVSPSELCEAIDRFYHRDNRGIDVGQPEPAQSPAIERSLRPGSEVQRMDESIQESLFPDISELGGEEPEIPDHFEPVTREGHPGLDPRSTAAPMPSLPRSSSGEPDRMLLRALCQLLIEKEVIEPAELQAQLRKLAED